MSANEEPVNCNELAFITTPAKSPVLISSLYASEKSAVVLKVGERDSFYIFLPNLKNKSIQINKQNVNVNALIGARFGAVFSVEKGKLEEIQPELMKEYFDKTADFNFAPAANNSNLFDVNTSQKLSMEEIGNMKKDLSGEEIISKLVENSATFHTKTEFSQMKYLKKKAEKYCPRVVLLENSPFVLCNAVFEKNPKKIQFLRSDSFAQILHYANPLPHSSSVTLVVDDCAGLIVSGVLERQGGLGTVCVMHDSAKANLHYVPFCNFSKEVLDTVVTLPLCHAKFISSVKEAQLKGESTAISIDSYASKITSENDRLILSRLVSTSVTCLVLCTEMALDPLAIVLLSILSPGSSFVVYSATLTPLLELYALFRSKRMGANLQVSETWYRQYQVLPNRTHPEMTTSGGGGYILTGIKVKSEFSALDEPSSTSNQESACDQNETQEPNLKKHKLNNE